MDLFTDKPSTPTRRGFLLGMAKENLLKITKTQRIMSKINQCNLVGLSNFLERFFHLRLSSQYFKDLLLNYARQNIRVAKKISNQKKN